MTRPAPASRSIAAAVPVQFRPQPGAFTGEGPASLTQLPASAATKCPVCAGTRVTKIAMVLTDGSPVDFTSCHTCEHRSWEHQSGGALEIGEVLSKARKLP